eukprot:6209633-Pleurochrysis_carterae.AAC.1
MSSEEARVRGSHVHWRHKQRPNPFELIANYESERRMTGHISERDNHLHKVLDARVHPSSEQDIVCPSGKLRQNAYKTNCWCRRLNCWPPQT